MSAKEQLRRLRKSEAEIDTLTQRILSLTEEAQALADTASGADVLDNIQRLQNLCSEKMRTTMQDREAAIQRILAIDDSDLRTLLLLYYCEGNTWDDVAEAMGYSRRQVTRLHREALHAFAQKKLA